MINGDIKSNNKSTLSSKPERKTMNKELLMHFELLKELPRWADIVEEHVKLKVKLNFKITRGVT